MKNAFPNRSKVMEIIVFTRSTHEILCILNYNFFFRAPALNLGLVELVVTNISECIRGVVLIGPQDASNALLVVSGSPHRYIFF